MPAIIESEPPVVVGFADMTTDVDFNGSYYFDCANNGAHISDRTKNALHDFDLISISESLSPMWKQTDSDYRDLHSLSGDVVVRHFLRVKPDIKQNPNPDIALLTIRDMLGLERRRRTRHGVVHVDAVINESVPRARYVMSTSEPTEFFLGQQWFLPFNPNRSPGLLTRTRGLSTAVVNMAFLLPQVRTSLCYQPQPGEIVRIDGRVHRKASRPYRGSEVGLTLIDDVGVKTG